MTKADKIKYSTAFSLLAIVSFFMIYREVALYDFTFSKGTIMETKSGYRGGLDISYNYLIGNKIFTSGGFINTSYSNKEYFLRKRFPICYSNSNNAISEILITPSDFKRHNIPYPDSLKWVLPLLD
jgi:hypothetical protein